MPSPEGQHPLIKYINISAVKHISIDTKWDEDCKYLHCISYRVLLPNEF